MKSKLKYIRALGFVAALSILAIGSLRAELLYQIDSFNNNNSTSNSQDWIPGISTITSASGVEGTDEAELLELQTVGLSPLSGAGGRDRFRNGESGQNNVRETLTTDARGVGRYFQFGIAAGSGEAFDLTSLDFKAVRATGGNSVRGYDIDVSINGGAYTDLAAANISNNRSAGLEVFSVALAFDPVEVLSIDFRFRATGGGIEWTDIAINGELIPRAPEPDPPLYRIASFNRNNSTSGSQDWIPGITTITAADGVSGTTDDGLLGLQTVGLNPLMGAGGRDRFRNGERNQNNVRQSLTIDAAGEGRYFQFGIVADSYGTIDLSGLSFQTVRATGGTQVRGYDIDVSFDGGPYIDLAAENIQNSRNDGLKDVTLAIPQTGLTSVDFRVTATGGGIELTNIAINGVITLRPDDTDGDGLTDAWELVHFGDLTSQDWTGDPDVDGYTNWEEERYEMDPNVAGGVPNVLNYDVWIGLEGRQVEDLIFSDKFREEPYVSDFVPGSAVSFVSEKYGSRLRGTVMAPVTGSYTFWVSGDDAVELWLSTDDKKFGRQKIAWHRGYTRPDEWEKYSTQQSAPICLAAGQKYYIEVLHKQRFGADHLGISWSYEADDLTNWARDDAAQASQSSTFNGAVAERAIDGNFDGDFFAESVNSTDPDQTNNWWQVDLGADRNMERVVLHNRSDCCPERLSNFRISVLNSAGVEVDAQDFHTDAGSHVERTLVWDLDAAVVGRTVRVALLGQNLAGNGMLSLAEVEVMGSASGAAMATPLTYLKNWTQEAGVAVSQSTVDQNGEAARAIDGSNNGNFDAGSVSQTADVAGSWWEVDLGVERDVSRIEIFNRLDCCLERLSNFRVILLDDAGAEIARDEFFTVVGHAGARFWWDLPAEAMARTVRIEKIGLDRVESHILSFAEVRVLGNMNQTPGAVVGREPLPVGVLESFALDPEDPDDDGLPTSWELQYDFDPNSNRGISGGMGDPDQDLIVNWLEFQLGNDPMVPEILDGALLHELWTNVPGKEVDDLRRSPKFLLEPEIRSLVYTTEGPSQFGTRYGNRIRGYITAPVTGNYTFWLTGNNETELWLSTDEDKFNREELIKPTLWTEPRRWDVDLSQKSRQVNLVEGQKYYLEIWHKEDIGGDNVSAAWQRPDGERELIPAEYLSTFLPQANDLDDDDLPDDWELANGLDETDNGSFNPVNGARGDLDGDGLKNHEEFIAGTRADLADSDGDGISDKDEVDLTEADADTLAGDVAPFLPVQTVAGSAYTDSFGLWSAESDKAVSRGVRGWVEYEIQIPSDGVYLLDLELEPRFAVSPAPYELTLSIDGQLLRRFALEIEEGASGNAKAITSWITAGTHTVRVFNDNALTSRRIHFNSLTVLSAQGGDLNGDGTPDWVEARLGRLNAMEAPATQSQISPIAIEGRSKFSGMLNLSNGESPLLLAGDRWTVDLALDSDAPVALQASFENGGLLETRTVEWVPTNLLEETSMSLRVGDSLRLTAHNGNSANGSDKVWVTVEGQTYYFKGKDPMEYRFDNPGQVTVDVVHRRGNGNSASETTNTVIVTVLAPVQIESPVTVVGSLREWDVPALPSGVNLEIDARVEVRDTIPLADGATRYIIASDVPETRYANIRDGVDGAILGVIPIRGLSIRDAGQTSMHIVQDFRDGSYQVDMPVVASSVYDDVVVHYNIFIAGVTFDTGGIDKDYFASDFDEFGRALVTFIKTGTDGSACHRTSVFQGGVRIAYFF